MTTKVLFGDKTITYSENFWTGKKTISIDGEELAKIDKITYMYEGNYCTLKGNYLEGVTFTIGSQIVTLVRKLTILEKILCFIPLIVIVTGGAIGGLCGGAACAYNLFSVRKTDKTIVKILTSVVSTVVAFVCYLILAGLLLSLFGL